MSTTLGRKFTLCKTSDKNGCGYIEGLLRFEDTFGRHELLLRGPVRSDKCLVCRLRLRLDLIIAKDAFQSLALEGRLAQSRVSGRGSMTYGYGAATLSFGYDRGMDAILKQCRSGIEVRRLKGSL